jgi:spore maturation protein CgeB
LRILLVLHRSPNPAFTSDLWKDNLYDPLVAMGHDVVLWGAGIAPLFDLDPDDPGTVEPRARFTDRFLAAVEDANRGGRLDLIFTYVMDSHLDPSAIDRVRERVAPIVNFFCNNVHQFHLVRRNARHYSFCLVPEAEALPRYKEAGAEPIFFPMAANPDRYRPIDTPYRYGATFSGQRYGDRTAGILALLTGGVDAHAFGQYWEPSATTAPASSAPRSAGLLKRAAALALGGRSVIQAVRDRRAWERLETRHPGALHGPVTDEEYVALFSESRISLGFLILGDTHRTSRPLRQIRLREFEAPMAGAFYVTGWLDEIALHYEIGKEIVCYRSLEELTDQCRHYITHDEERERIRRAGHERARRDHTWTKRFEGLFAELRRLGVLRGA